MWDWQVWAMSGLAVAALGLGTAGWWQLTGQGRVRRRLDRWSSVADDALQAMGTASTAWRRLARWTAPLRRLAEPRRPPTEGPQANTVTEGLEGPLLRFAQAGLRHRQAVAAYFGLKALIALALPLAGLALITVTGWPLRGAAAPVALLLLAALGYYGPNVWLARRIQRRQRLIFESFPDALDLMTVCVEAGLGTEAALLRVSQDLALQSPELAEELRLVHLELRAGASREAALRHLAARTGVEEIDGFVTLLLQAERFGTPMAQALRVHAQALRTLRRQRAEEAAAQIALKLLFPLIFCIFPSLMVVLMGPAMIQIHRVLLPSMAGTG
jgi:tight adherence protein C